MRIAILKPSPSSPSRLSAGIRMSLKKISPVVEPLMPIFGSIRPTSNPGAVGLDGEGRDARVARLGVGLGEDRVEARDPRVRDEALRRR